MLHDIRSAFVRCASTAVEDALGAAALFALLGVGLYLPLGA